MDWLGKVVLELLDRHEFYESQKELDSYGYGRCITDLLDLLPYPVYAAMLKEMPSEPRRISPDEINLEEFEKMLESLRKKK